MIHGEININQETGGRYMIDKQKIKELHIKRNVILLAMIAGWLFVLKIVILYMLGIKDPMLRAYINFLLSMGFYIL